MYSLTAFKKGEAYPQGLGRWVRARGFALIQLPEEAPNRREESAGP